MSLLEFVTYKSLGDDLINAWSAWYWAPSNSYGALHSMLKMNMEQSELLMVSTTGAPPVTSNSTFE